MEYCIEEDIIAAFVGTYTDVNMDTNGKRGKDRFVRTQDIPERVLSEVHTLTFHINSPKASTLPQIILSFLG
jgi:hypothetical protein